MSRMPEVQTTIDETSDGQWEGVLYVGSNFVTRLHRKTFLECAQALKEAIDVEQERRDGFCPREA